jgi:valyl-tRNA synthetase
MAGTGTKFDGLDRFEARKAVVEELRKQGRVVAEKRPYVHAVGHCQRCDTTVEPRLSKQWFVKVAPLAKAAAEAVRDGRVKIEPEQMSPRYFEWVDNMHDWCISRQLWWGHRIPVFYGPNDEVIVCGPDEKPPAGYTQDPDVLDTWFSSALWPFSTLGWPEESDDLKKFYPTSVLVTGYDILFFWVARMMIMGLFAMDGKQPFDVIALHGLVRDQFGKKMSKSRGNTVDPIEFMDKYGSDALRFTLARGANPGTDQALAEDWVAGSRNFATKLWNATRFGMLNGANVSGDLAPRKELNAIDNWILTRLDQTVADCDELFEKFEFAKACDLIYHFAWDDLCDWYLELSKSTFTEAGAGAGKSARVLGEVLDQLFRLMHPVMPFITEELWCCLTNNESLMIASWPKSDLSAQDQASVKLVAKMQEIVTEIRRFRNDQGIKSTAKVNAKFTGLKEAGLESYESALRHIVKCEAGGDKFTAKTQIGNVTVEFDLTGAIDLVAERSRLSKDLQTAQKDRDTAKVKLDNEGFMAKAPMEVVTEIRERLAQTTEDIARITALLEKLPK